MTMTQSSPRSRLASVLVALVLVVAALSFARNSGTAQEASPAGSEFSLSNGPRSTKYADEGKVREVDRPVGGWRVLGPVRWIPLRDHYHGLTFLAVNRTGMDRSAVRGPSVRAAYDNAPGMFMAGCEAARALEEEPNVRKELRAIYGPPQQEQVIPPGEKARFICSQYKGGLPGKAELPAGGLRVDPQTFTLLSR